MGLLEEIFQAEMGARLNPNPPPPQPISYSNITPEQMVLAREALGQQAGPTSGMQTISFAKPEDPFVPMMPAPNPWSMFGGFTPVRESWRDDVQQSYETDVAPYNYVAPITRDVANVATGTDAPIETSPWDIISAGIDVIPGASGAISAPFRVAKPLAKPAAKPILKKGGEIASDVGALFGKMKYERASPFRWGEPFVDMAKNIKDRRGMETLKNWMGRPNINTRVNPESEKFFEQMQNIQGERITDRMPIGAPVNPDAFSGPQPHLQFRNPTIRKAGERLNEEILQINDVTAGIGRKYRNQVNLENIFASKQRSQEFEFMKAYPASLVFDTGTNPVKGKLRVNIPGANDIINEGSMFNKGTGDPNKTWLEQFEATVGDYLSNPVELQWMFYRDVVDELQSVHPENLGLPRLISLRDDSYRLGNSLAKEVQPHLNRLDQINTRWDELQDLNLRLWARWNEEAANRVTAPKLHTDIVQKTAIPAISIIPEVGNMAQGAEDIWNIATSDWTQPIPRY